MSHKNMLHRIWIIGGVVLSLCLSTCQLAAQGTDKLDSPAKVESRETWRGTLGAGIKLEFQIRLVKDPQSQEDVCYFDSVSQNAFGLEAILQKEDGQFVFKVPAVQGKFAGKLSEDGTKAEGFCYQGSIELPLELVKTDTVVEAAEIKRPQLPTPPYGYRSENVRFPSEEENISLAGSLTMPSKSEPGEKYPAAVLISGSGPQDRDVTIFGHKLFLVIADNLTKKGIAVLRFDDRGTAESTGDHSLATTAGFANDVRGAVDYLRTRPDIDSEKIGIIGHSEGGLIGPLVTAQDHDLAFLVVLAGSGVVGEEIILNQAPAISHSAGKSKAKVDLQRQQLHLLLNSAKEGIDKKRFTSLAQELAKQYKDQASKEDDAATPNKVDLDDLITSQYQKFQSPWYRFFITYDPIPALENTSCPILALIGEKDIQADPKLNMEPIKKAVKRAGNQKSMCQIMPGLNHLFQETKTGSVQEYQSIEQTFSPTALDLISNWILSLEDN